MSRTWLAKPVCLMLACMMSIVGCGGSDEAATSEPSTPIPLAAETPATDQAEVDADMPAAVPLIVELNVTVKENAQHHLIAVGKTNLPDQTQLKIRLVRDASRVSWRAKTQVAAGVFEVGPLGPSSGLIAGDYTFHVSMPPADVQPTEVKAAIGEQGELLDGPFVERSPHGLGRIVNYATTYEAFR